MKEYPRISDLTDTHNGIQTSKNDIYLIPKKKIIKETKDQLIFENKGKEWRIEKVFVNRSLKILLKRNVL